MSSESTNDHAELLLEGAKLVYVAMTTAAGVPYLWQNGNSTNEDFARDSARKILAPALDELDRLRAKCELLTKMHDAINERMSFATAERDALRAKHDFLASENTDLCNQLNKIGDALGMMEEDDDIVRAAQTAVKNASDQLDRANALHAECDALRAEVDKFQQLHSKSVRAHANIVWENDVPYADIVALRAAVAQMVEALTIAREYVNDTRCCASTKELRSDAEVDLSKIDAALDAAKTL